MSEPPSTPDLVARLRLADINTSTGRDAWEAADEIERLTGILKYARDPGKSVAPYVAEIERLTRERDHFEMLANIGRIPGKEAEDRDNAIWNFEEQKRETYRLQDQIERLTRELQWMTLDRDAHQRVSLRAMERADGMHAALSHYGDHLVDCSCEAEKPCDCGFTEALRGAGKKA